ncbi:MAG: 16S rRNA (uracil(1498)-N(3))-methyltransferase [Ruminococcaceae bacterium]|nr:16S rRNA (uracil(1498)-N(3))-methyltransferase [Oscillospiraceae bacterium]
MRRFFTEPQNISGNTANIFEDSKHIEKVLRMKCGDEILIFDGTGYEYTARLTAIEKNLCKAEILKKEISLSEPKTKITLFQGLPKSGKMELIVQKAVELGVMRVVPVMMERCVTKIANAAAGAEKAKRWNKVSVEAAKQCGRGLVPEVLAPVTFEKAIEMLAGIQLPLMPYEVLGHEGRCDLKGVLGDNPDATEFGILVGPEGGFSDEEAAFAIEHGIRAVGLGKRILRTETVASALIPVIMYDRGEL